jgi:hypothetical protein
MDGSAKPQTPASLGNSPANSANGIPKRDDSIDKKDFGSHMIDVEQSRVPSTSTGGERPSREETPPPLPPRPKNLQLLDGRPQTSGSLNPSRPPLQSKATIQLSLADTQSYSDKSKDTVSSDASKQMSYQGLGVNRSGSEADDSASIKSFAPTIGIGGDAESLLGEVLYGQDKVIFKSLGHRFGSLSGHSERIFPDDPEFEDAFEHEFDEVEEMKADGSNEGQMIFRMLGAPADFLSFCRSCNESMEIEIKAFPHPVFCRQANL